MHRTLKKPCQKKQLIKHSPRPDPPATAACLGALGPRGPLRPGGTPLRVAGTHLPRVPGAAVQVRPVGIPRRRGQKAVTDPLRGASAAGCRALKLSSFPRRPLRSYLGT